MKGARTDVFLSFQPKADSLKGKIAYYYFHFSNDPENEISFQYYPHFRNALTVYLDGDVVLDGLNSSVNSGQAGNYTCIYSRNYDQSVQVRIAGRFLKMGVAFEPLGYNHFIPTSLSKWIPEGKNDVTDLEKSLEAVARKCFDHPGDQTVELLDHYFLSRKRESGDLTTLNSVILELLDTATSPSVAQLSEKLHIDRRTVLRLFQRHLGTSVREYQQLIKFRLALNHYQEAEKGTRFTDLAHDHRYYDQPAFIRHFKKITEKTPRKFFKDISRFGRFDTYWTNG